MLKWGVYSVEWRRTAGCCWQVSVGFVTVSACFSMVINTTGHAKISIREALETLMDTLCMLPHKWSISQQGKVKFKSALKCTSKQFPEFWNISCSPHLKLQTGAVLSKNSHPRGESHHDLRSSGGTELSGRRPRPLQRTGNVVPQNIKTSIIWWGGRLLLKHDWQQKKLVEIANHLEGQQVQIMPGVLSPFSNSITWNDMYINIYIYTAYIFDCRRELSQWSYNNTPV